MLKRQAEAPGTTMRLCEEVAGDRLLLRGGREGEVRGGGTRPRPRSGGGGGAAGRSEGGGGEAQWAAGLRDAPG